MFTLAICLCFLSVFGLYTQSKKVETEPKGFMLFLKTRKVLARAISGSALFVSTVLFIGQMGFAVGIFTEMLMWMLLACLLVLFMPFGKVTWGHLALSVIVIAGIEVSTLYL